MIREVLVAVSKSSVPLTSRQVADAIGMNYERNFNKREFKYAQRLTGFVVKRQLKPEEMIVPTTLVHWMLDARWEGQCIDEVLKSFDASGITANERETQLDRIEAKLDQVLATMQPTA